MAEKEFSPKYSTSLVEQLTRFLTNAIIEGDLESGQRLVENELQRKYGISRAPIRESLRILEENGLIVRVPRKGSKVRDISRKDFEENLQIIAILEGFAARLAISHLSPKDIENMELALSKMMEGAKKNDFKSFYKYHAEYHKVFVLAARNDTLVGIIENLRRQATWFFSYFRFREIEEYPINEHREILDLFIKGSTDQIETIVREHIFSTLKKFLQFLALNKQKDGKMIGNQV